ncbi:isopentenyl-diphosphate delta-isomerase [Candidatus Woesearchaeota archaeon]|nr:isopentenyl-diphosphate delta-isomerase [Candidatus Woesearchaeota archaeon]|tara:strand:- start:10893 stop:11414 length:522 start_codon:yes stop_codon:yes gene_type:complete
MEEVILVDENDKQIGTAEKLQAHKDGKLHRAFSVFVFNSEGKLLLQQRAKSKYHSPGLWTNTVCSHPRLGESVEQAAHRRLKEEMGFDCELKEAFTFTYKTKFDNGLTENEFDHVLIGNYDGNPTSNPEEVESWKWVEMEELKKDIQANPENYSYWLRVAIDKVENRFSEKTL